MAFKRNKETGLIEGLEYQYDDNGLINWFKMLPPKYLAVKKDKKDEVEKRYGKKVDDLDLSTIEDYYLYIKLNGMNYLANLRGYNKLEQKVDSVTDTKAVCTCGITFVPNIENPDGLFVNGVASASVYNVSAGFESFLETLAENRSFARAVRRGLRISVVTQEELGEGVIKNPVLNPVQREAVPTQPMTPEPYALLANQCEKLGYTFKAIKTAATNKPDGVESDPSLWNSWKDIPSNDIWTILEKINKAAEKKKVATKE